MSPVRLRLVVVTNELSLFSIAMDYVFTRLPACVLQHWVCCVTLCMSLFPVCFEPQPLQV